MLGLSVLKYAGRNLSVVMRFGSMAMLMLVMLVSLWLSVRSRSTVKRKRMPPACSASVPASARAARQRESVGDHAPAEKMVVAIIMLSSLVLSRRDGTCCRGWAVRAAGWSS